MKTIEARLPLLRGLLVAGVGSIAVGAAGWWLALVCVQLWRSTSEPTPLTADEALRGAAAVAGSVVVIWLGASVLVALLARLPGQVGRAARWVEVHATPVLARRVAGILLGAGLGAGLTPGPAMAAPTSAMASVAVEPARADGAPVERARVGRIPDAPAVAPPPHWTPERPRIRPQPSPGLVTTPSREPAETDEVVVCRGDSLWSIVADWLGPGATDFEIADAWPRWHEANLGVIGPDPDLILPGQRLRPPGPTGSPADPSLHPSRG